MIEGVLTYLKVDVLAVITEVKHNCEQIKVVNYVEVRDKVNILRLIGDMIIDNSVIVVNYLIVVVSQGEQIVCKVVNVQHNVEREAKIREVRKRRCEKI